MVVNYEGEDSEDVYTANELGFKDTVPDSITMGHPETGVTEKFIRVEGSVNEDANREEEETLDSDEIEDESEDESEEADHGEEWGESFEGGEISGEEYVRGRLNDLSWPQLQSVGAAFEDVGGKKADIIDGLVEEDVGEVSEVIDGVRDTEE